MIPDPIIDSFPQGMYVVHPSLLPKYRGASPIQHAIMNREERTGVSIIEISKGVFDAGPVVWQKSVQIGEDKTFGQLASELSNLGGEGLLEILSNLDLYKSQALP